MDGDVDAVVFVAGARNGVGEAVGIGAGVAVLFLFEGEEVVGRDALDDVVGARGADFLDDGGDADAVFLRERGGGDGVVARLDLVDAFDEEGEGNVGPGVLGVDVREHLGDVVVLA